MTNLQAPKRSNELAGYLADYERPLVAQRCWVSSGPLLQSRLSTTHEQSEVKTCNAMHPEQRRRTGFAEARSHLGTELREP